jgi:hypothetical protein
MMHWWAGPSRKAKRSGPVPRKGSTGHKEDAGRNVNGLQKLFFNFLNKDLSLKVKDSNAFKSNLNCNKPGINLNNFLRTFQTWNFQKLI